MLKIWTDGACIKNPGPGGWGYVRSDGFEECGGDPKTTNNRMEMQAINQALARLPDGEVVTVYSDSQYCVKGLTVWHSGWKKKNWMKKGEPMLNRDLWLELHEHTSRLQASFEWVRGHNGDQMNERADALASMGAKQSGVLISNILSTTFNRPESYQVSTYDAVPIHPKKITMNDVLSAFEACNDGLKLMAERLNKLEDVMKKYSKN